MKNNIKYILVICVFAASSIFISCGDKHKEGDGHNHGNTTENHTEDDGHGHEGHNHDR